MLPTYYSWPHKWDSMLRCIFNHHVTPNAQNKVQYASEGSSRTWLNIVSVNYSNFGLRMLRLFQSDQYFWKAVTWYRYWSGCMLNWPRCWKKRGIVIPFVSKCWPIEGQMMIKFIQTIPSRHKETVFSTSPGAWFPAKDTTTGAIPSWVQENE